MSTLKGGIIVAKGAQRVGFAVWAAKAEQHNLITIQWALQALVLLHCPSLPHHNCLSCQPFSASGPNHQVQFSKVPKNDVGKGKCLLCKKQSRHTGQVCCLPSNHACTTEHAQIPSLSSNIQVRSINMPLTRRGPKPKLALPKKPGPCFRRAAHHQELKLTPVEHIDPHLWQVEHFFACGAVKAHRPYADELHISQTLAAFPKHLACIPWAPTLVKELTLIPCWAYRPGLLLRRIARYNHSCLYFKRNDHPLGDCNFHVNMVPPSTVFYWAQYRCAQLVMHQPVGRMLTNTQVNLTVKYTVKYIVVMSTALQYQAAERGLT